MANTTTIILSAEEVFLANEEIIVCFDGRTFLPAEVEIVDVVMALKALGAKVDVGGVHVDIEDYLG